MAYYRVCPLCGSNLDPGEVCDCQEQKEKKEAVITEMVITDPKTGNLVLNFDYGRRKAV